MRAAPSTPAPVYHGEVTGMLCPCHECAGRGWVVPGRWAHVTCERCKGSGMERVR